jgi:CRP-like cAMP-binding protein
MTRQLLRNKILTALSPEDIELLRPVDVEFPRGHVIFDRGGRVDRLYLPHTALVSLVTHLRDGGTIETGTVGSEGILGAFAIDGDDIALSRSVIQIPGLCGVVTLDRAKKAFEKSQTVRVLIGYFQHAFTAQLLQQIACNTAHPVNSRCARWILTSPDRIEGGVVPLTHELMGEMLGTTRPTVSVALKELQNAGIIESSYGRIRVLDRARLEHATCECYRTMRDTYKRLLPGFARDDLQVQF